MRDRRHLEHSGGTAYSEHNHGFATEWVLQWLFIVSGIAFMMSKATFSAYFVRYGTVFAVGVVFNIIGDAIARPEWYRDLGNTIFQMFYVVFITAVSFAAWPLRSVMRLEDDPFGGSTSIFGMQDRLLCLILYGTLFAASYLTYLVGWDLRALVSGLERGNSWSSFIVDVGEVFFYIISHLLICPTLVALHIYLRRTPHSAKLLSWIFLALTYLPIVLFPTQMAYGPQCIMLYFLGLYVSRHPFAGTETIARTLRAYSAIFYDYPAPRLHAHLIRKVRPLPSGDCLGALAMVLCRDGPRDHTPDADDRGGGPVRYGHLLRMVGAVGLLRSRDARACHADAIRSADDLSDSDSVYRHLEVRAACRRHGQEEGGQAAEYKQRCAACYAGRGTGGGGRRSSGRMARLASGSLARRGSNK